MDSDTSKGIQDVLHSEGHAQFPIMLIRMPSRIVWMAVLQTSKLIPSYWLTATPVIDSEKYWYYTTSNKLVYMFIHLHNCIEMYWIYIIYTIIYSYSTSANIGLALALVSWHSVSYPFLQVGQIFATFVCNFRNHPPRFRCDRVCLKVGYPSPSTGSSSLAIWCWRIWPGMPPVFQTHPI